MEAKLLTKIELDVLELSNHLSSSQAKWESILIIHPTYESAKKVFRASLSSYKESMKIFTFEEHASEYVEVMKDMQALYSHSMIPETGNNF